MPEMTPIPPPPNPLQTLSGIMGIKQQQQALQTGQYNQATAQAESQQAQQKNAELQAVGNLTKNAYNPRYSKPDGTFDNQAFADDVARVAPTYGQQIANDATSRAGELYKNQQTLFNLQTSKREQVANMLGGLAADPTINHSKMIDAVENMREQYPDDKDLSRMLTSMASGMPNTSGAALQQGLRNAAVMANAPAAAQTNPQIGTYQGASGIQAYQSNPQAVGGVQNVGKPLGPQGITPQVIQQPITQAPAIIGGSQGATPRPIGAGPNWQPGPGQAQNVTGMATDDAGRYSQVSQEGINAQSGAQLADQVSRLAEQVRTGKLTKEWADRLAVLKQNDPAITDRQMLTKYAAQLKTMAHDGAATDASRGQVDEGMPSPETMDPDAVKQASQYVGGIFRMRAARQGVADQYVKNNGNSIGIRGADDAFMQAADPTIFAYKALPAGADRQEFLKNHGLTTPAAQQAFKARMNQVNHYSGGQ
jgi:hypothetical protein